MINVLEISNGTFKVSKKIKIEKVNVKKITSTCSGGSDLSFLNDIKIEERKQTTIKVFSNDYVINVRRKIAAFLGEVPSHLFIFEFQEKIAIDGVKVEAKKEELLLPYSDKNNLLYKHRNFDILNMDQMFIGDISEFNVLPLYAYTSQKNEVYLYYCMKFWTKLNALNFNSATKVDLNFPDEEFHNINKIIPPCNFYINYIKADCFYKKTDLLEYINKLDLIKVDGVFAHIYINNHIVKYVSNIWNPQYAHKEALTIGIKKGNILLIFRLYRDGRVAIESSFSKNGIGFIEDIIRKTVFILFGISDINIKKINILTAFKLRDLKYIQETNGSLTDIIEVGDIIKGAIDVNVLKGVITQTTLRFITDKNKIILNTFIDYRDLEFILKLITYYENNSKKRSSNEVDFNNINKNKRLMERDPVAYVMDHAKWSMSCQKKMQPIIFNKTEYELLDKKIRDSCVKYWNFTQEEDAYYYCPDERFPHVYFKDTNPNMALPCCGKRDEKQISDIHKQAYEETIETHVYIKPELQVNYAYIINYGKTIPQGRVSHVPDVFNFGDKYVLFEYEKIDDSISEIKIDDIGGNIYISKFYITDEYRICLENSNGKFNIVEIDKESFSKTNEIKSKVFNKDNELIKFLFNFRIKTEYERITEKLNYKVIETYSSGEMLLFVLLANNSEKVLLPINEYNYILESKQAYPIISKLKINRKFVIDTCKKLYEDFYISYNIYNGKDNIGFVYDNKTYFHSPQKYEGGRKVYIPYDISDIFSSIYNSKKSNIEFSYDNISKLYDEKHNAFDRINNSQNIFIRKKLKELIDKEDFFEIQNLVNDNDYIIIKKMMLDHNKSDVILERSFDFDIKKITSSGINNKTLSDFIDMVIENPNLKNMIKDNIKLFNVKDIKLYPGEYLNIYG